MIIYRLTDRVPVKASGITFWLSPLSYEQKTNLLECRKTEGGKEVVDGGQRARLSIKYAVKGVDGLKCHDGSDYATTLDDDGTLSMGCVDELMGLDCMLPLVQSCLSLLAGVSDPKIEGVEFDLKGVVSSEKKD